ncbi:hypothetical protein ASD65_11775 [Microbacterium sp. Root61]|uniref:LpqN/LpqT family lipoprotein n=1 Tax=Microbacterium sp. Root61 TaxID=1736570 RepID=UPI0006F34567|nr:LpqN/LpqT family lipoprotein [Microbacterium sp. Root61]KRA25027.1 hypothetical protein ASD65_11775 [Microbacterium sp. Root61]
MPEASFPSAAFPAFPAVSLQHPDEWTPRAVVNTLFAVIDDRGADAFSPNVVAGVTRAVGAVTLEQAAAAVQADIAALNEVAPVDAAQVGFDGTPWFVSEFAHLTEAAGTVIQIIAVTVVESGPFTDVIRVTGTSSPADYEQSLPVIRKIIASTRITAG